MKTNVNAQRKLSPITFHAHTFSVTTNQSGSGKYLLQRSRAGQVATVIQWLAQLNNSNRVLGSNPSGFHLAQPCAATDQTPDSFTPELTGWTSSGSFTHMHTPSSQQRGSSGSSKPGWWKSMTTEAPYWESKKCFLSKKAKSRIHQTTSLTSINR